MDDKPSVDEKAILEKIEELTSVHRALDHKLLVLNDEPLFDQLQAQRLKKEKLAIKDQIRLLEDMLIPDIIA